MHGAAQVPLRRMASATPFSIETTAPQPEQHHPLKSRPQAENPALRPESAAGDELRPRHFPLEQAKAGEPPAHRKAEGRALGRTMAEFRRMSQELAAEIGRELGAEPLAG